MEPGPRFSLIATVLGLTALGHAALTWPPQAIIALFGGGALIAFVAEAIVIDRGWLEHHLGPTIADVPIYALFGWTGVIYAALRLALLGTGGPTAAIVAGGIATAYDVSTDHRGVAEGHWTYTDDLPGPRFRGVPWWNFVGWFAISTLTSVLAVHSL